jgi:pyruvate dehydrogenase E2 component (dihydrolipoamide acetyltransferase)
MSLTGELIAQTPMRKAIARRMSDSKREAPHFYASAEIEMDAVGAFIAEERDRGGRRITTTAALVRACVAALRSNPRVNSIWTDQGLLQVQEINVGVAIALDDGLIAPALLGADQLDLAGTAAALDDLVERARAGRLRASELSDATFTLSNLGMFQVSAFSAIVTPPQVAILATGRIVARVVPGDSGPRVASVLTPTLSVDHRALDGADAARFLGVLKQTLETPNRALNGFPDE